MQQSNSLLVWARLIRGNITQVIGVRGSPKCKLQNAFVALQKIVYCSTKGARVRLVPAEIHMLTQLTVITWDATLGGRLCAGSLRSDLCLSKLSE